MLSDIEIAQQANMKKITEVAASLGISEDDIEPYGHYKAKLSDYAAENGITDALISYSVANFTSDTGLAFLG